MSMEKKPAGAALQVKMELAIAGTRLALEVVSDYTNDLTATLDRPNPEMGQAEGELRKALHHLVRERNVIAARQGRQRS